MQKETLLVFGILVIAGLTFAVYAFPGPNLYIYQLSFVEWNGMIRTPNGTFNGTVVNVTTIVANTCDNDVAPATTTRTSNLLGNVDHPTPFLAGCASYTIRQAYLCTTAHTHTATADYYDAAAEWDETDNTDSIFIDCIV